MSQSKNRYEAERWLRTAEEDLHAAKTLYKAGVYAQACFHSQQSAEKAVKSLWYLVDADPWGHSVQQLINKFPQRDEIEDVGAWLKRAALLDKFYIPTRYPNGLPDLTPGQVYQQEEAIRGIEAAGALLEGCREWFVEEGSEKPTQEDIAE